MNDISTYMPKKVEYWRLDMSDLGRITKYVYGKEYDVQMGEKPNGSYEIVTPGEPDGIQGYHTGMESDYYGNRGLAGGGTWVELTDEEAIERWVNQPEPKNQYARPFEKLNEKGEYEFWQPELAVVLGDLVKRGILPAGDYFIDIWW